jgi:hypothetical protein
MLGLESEARQIGRTPRIAVEDAHAHADLRGLVEFAAGQQPQGKGEGR